MHLAKEDLPARIESADAVARHQPGFGSITGYTEISAEFFTMKKGTDIAPLLESLPEGACNSPHWGYMLEGAVTVHYTNGTEEVTTAGDVFYWPPGHSVRVDEDASFVLFSPTEDHARVLDHMAAQIP